MANRKRVRRSLPRGTGGGDLVDQITRLEIQLEEGLEPAQAAEVKQEVARLRVRRMELLDGSDDLSMLAAQLKAINQTLRYIEDELRHRDRHHEFGQHFVELARALYLNQEQRAALIRRIDRLRRRPVPLLSSRSR